MTRALVATVLLLAWRPCGGEAQERFLSKLSHPSGMTVVVAEGDFEARSVGSFSVRVYEAAPSPDETTFFASGLVHARDGAVERIMLAELDGDGIADLVVVARSAGTGGYLSAYGFALTGDGVRFLRGAEGLAPDTDPVAALRGSDGSR